MIMPVPITRNEIVELIEDLDEIRTRVKDLAMDDYEQYDPEVDELFNNHPVDMVLSDLYEIIERLEGKLNWREDEGEETNCATVGEIICGVGAVS
jgi:uncharacterized protein Yka (UPF0111/DUF47 family)